MKRVLPILGIAAIAIILFTACGSRQGTDSASLVASVDTTGQAQFEAWKKQQEFAQQYALYQAEMEKNAPKAVATNRSVAPRKTKQGGSMSTTTSYPAKNCGEEERLE